MKKMIVVLVLVIGHLLISCKNPAEPIRKYEYYGMSSFIWPPDTIKICIDSLDTGCRSNDQNSISGNNYDFMITIEFDTLGSQVILITSNGACATEKLLNNDSLIKPMEIIPCDSLNMLVNNAEKCKIEEKEFVIKNTFQTNIIYIVKISNGRKIIVSRIGEYIGGYNRIQLFWAIL